MVTADRHNCLTSAKNHDHRDTDIDNARPTAKGMTNQQNIFVNPWSGQRKLKYSRI